MSLPRILFLGQYSLDVLDSAPKVRTWALWKALEKVADVTFITGTRSSRRALLWRLIQKGNLKRFDAVYLEAATSTSTETDLLLLLLLKCSRVPIGIYIRDAYPLFGLSPVRSLKEYLLNKSWFISQWAYRKLADILFYPTQSLANCFDFKHKVLLPPAANTDIISAVNQGPFDTLFYVGHLNEDNGWSLLRDSMEKIHKDFPSIRLLALTHSQISENYPWLEIRKGVLQDILPDLPRIAAALIPRPQTAYNNLAIPVKLMDYLSLGLPIISTACNETAKIIENENIGFVASSDNFSFLALKMITDTNERNIISEKVLLSVKNVNNWDKRAVDLLSVLLKPIVLD
jgi:glycosyltransferase involved in cell wall biosynthesis